MSIIVLHEYLTRGFMDKKYWREIIKNIEGKDISDKCQQETFHDFLFHL